MIWCWLKEFCNACAFITFTLWDFGGQKLNSVPANDISGILVYCVLKCVWCFVICIFINYIYHIYGLMSSCRFYTLMVLSTALFGKPAFKNLICNGLVLAEDGKKMSKSKKNYPSPVEVIDEYGAVCGIFLKIWMLYCIFCIIFCLKTHAMTWGLQLHGMSELEFAI